MGSPSIQPLAILMVLRCIPLQNVTPRGNLCTIPIRRGIGMNPAARSFHSRYYQRSDYLPTRSRRNTAAKHRAEYVILQRYLAGERGEGLIIPRILIAIPPIPPLMYGGDH